MILELNIDEPTDPVAASNIDRAILVACHHVHGSRRREVHD
jgi:hypothetical protein